MEGVLVSAKRIGGTITVTVASDKTGYVWAAGWTTALVSRLNPKTGELIQYLLPGINTEIRRVSVDDSVARPIFWAGENAEPRVVKVEVLD